MVDPDVKPVVVTMPESSSGPRMTPKQQIYVYDDVQWEELVREWVTIRKVDYLQVVRYGGAGDLGIDIAGVMTLSGLQGVWDCFQCKHYAKSLAPADAMAEIYKILRFVTAGVYVLPRAYYFVAPRNCGTKLQRMLNNPSELKEHFIKEMTKQDSVLRKDAVEKDFKRVLSFAEGEFDFSIFQSILVEDMLLVHSATRYHVVRFGERLPVRPAPDVPTDEVNAHEERYVEQLMQVYEEKYLGSAFTPESVLEHETLGEHFRRQRQDFFSAESLLKFARDSVPEETFVSLQDEVYAGVIDVAEIDYPNGMARLAQVLNSAGSLVLTSNVLITVTRVHDRKGMCHQLANVDRLKWTKGGES
ncbi:hypothetical protein B1H26_00775 [Amycolatopsis sp. BJA-103]|nr:hypothetical protein BKN51_31645 [Amycolatopsis sp. BJA-103]PNE22065.1 hypothetical protein B1H26_00775 [Amycolatopsis sp. BJA-103]